MSMALRCVVYLMLSVLTAGVVAVLARLPTYGGTGNGAFLIYTLPFPFSLGMFHLPAQCVGLVLVGMLSWRAAVKPILWSMCVLLVVLAMTHVMSGLERSDNILVFAYLTNDVIWVTLFAAWRWVRDQRTAGSLAV